MKTLIIASLVFVSGFYAYRHWQPSQGLLEERIARTNALILFKIIEHSQFEHWSENGKLASSLDKLGNDYAIKAMASASNNAQPYQEFLLREVTGGGANGSTLYGLLLFPAGSISGKGYALLIDTSQLQVSETGRPAGQMGMLYAFKPTDAGAANTWPSDAVLAQWEKIERLTPQQALEKARELARSADTPNQR